MWQNQKSIKAIFRQVHIMMENVPDIGIIENTMKNI